MRPGSLISLFTLLILSASVGATEYGGDGGKGNEVGYGGGGPGKDDGKGPGYGNDDKGPGKGGKDDDKGPGYGNDDKGPGKGGKDDDKGPGKGGKDDDKGPGKGAKDDDKGPGKGGKDDDKGHGGGKGQDHDHGDDKPGNGGGHGYGHDHHDNDHHGPGGGHGNGGGNGNGNGNGGGHGGGNGGGNGNQCKTYKTCPSGYGKRDLKAHCAHGLTACGVYGGSPGAWECVDTKRDLESCGGCMISLHPTLPATDGVDCTAIAGVADVACVQGQCFVRRCMPGYVVSPEGDDCLYFGDADPGVLAAHYGLD